MIVDPIVKEFKDAVNMTASQIDLHLKTPESRRVGYKSGGQGESVGHKSGRRIVKLLRKKQSEFTANDRKHMHKVVGYVRRHLAQRPSGDIEGMTWRISLMNWGHDPLKS